MKNFFLWAFTILCSLPVYSQIQDPVDVTHSVKRINDTEAELQVTATMDDHWHIYATDLPEESFVIATELNVETGDGFQTVGGIMEPQPIEEYDPNFQEVLKWHDNKVTFSQKIKILTTNNLTVKAEFVYQPCNEEMCLPPEYVDLEFSVKGAPAEALQDEPIKEGGDSKQDTPDESEEASAEDVAPGVDEEELEIDYAVTDGNTDDDEQDTLASDEELMASETGGTESSPSYWGVFILSFLGGFAALLTPCVFPMIPLTVSFFTKQSKNRAKGIGSAVIYGAAIILLYTAIGFAITKVFGSSALNELSTNPWLNLFFFVLLVVFAISFFGAFEITLPSSWVNKADRASDKGGIIGIFFMALTLAIVSFSCTGPIIGGLLAEAASGGIQGPLVGMFGFSLALALPFTLFAIFPSWLNSLPKSGGWLNSVKVVLGFLELAFAFKFLSNADLVWQAGLLQREVFIAIWVAILLLLTLYLLGVFRMPHDSPVEKLTVPRLMFAIVSLFFVLYMLPGMWGAPLKIFSGFTPPDFYAESPGGFANTGGQTATAAEDIPEGAHPETCPLGLNCFHDYEQGLAYAKEVNKPILLDFTGWGCANCRKMEANVWSDPKVLEILRDEVVVISLYVDERERLPEDEQYTSPVTGKKIKTVGNKWSEFQVKHYKTNSQPQYVIVGHENLNPLVPPTAYDPDVEKYLQWLKSGIEEFEEKNPELAGI